MLYLSSPLLISLSPKLRHGPNYKEIFSNTINETPGHMDENYAQKRKHAFLTIQRAINNTTKLLDSPDTVAI